MLFEPLQSLQEGALLGILAHLVTYVASDRKAVLDPAVEIDLVRQTRLLQDLLGLVTLVCWKDGIRLGGTDSQRTLDLLELLGLDEARMRTVSSIELALIGPEVADDILGSEAVTDGADLSAAELRAHFDEGGVDDGVDGWGQVAGGSVEPFHQVETFGPIQGYGISVVDVGHDDKVSVRCELVGDELGVDESVTNHIGETGVL